MPAPARRGAIVGGVVALTLGVPTAVGASDQLVQHAECETATVVAQAMLWTPIYIVDSAPDGWANATAYAPQEPIRFSNGTSVGIFSLDAWTLYSEALRWLPGPGAVPSCPAYSAVDQSRTPGGPPSLAVESVTLLPEGSTNDSAVPEAINESLNGTMFGSVIFFAGLSPTNETSGFTVCGQGSLTWTTVTATPLEIVLVPFSRSSGPPVVGLVQLAGDESLAYYLPGSGSWLISWDDEPSPFGTGLSFAWDPLGESVCTSF
ncbi:MAG: hypothetical protein ACRECT_06430 [Thermoplasmata archaeon]